MSAEEFEKHQNKRDEEGLRGIPGEPDAGDRACSGAGGAPPEIPNYELIKPVGRGSYGEVWLARSILGAHHAVKIVSRRTFGSERPFEREFEGIRRFEPVSRSHESQLTVLHVGRGEGYFYYVMELADDASGEPNGARSTPPPLVPAFSPLGYRPRTLRWEIERRGRLPCDECLHIALKLSEALGHLHQHGLVHRDIKPSNVIFVNGRPKLADIGLVADTAAALSFVGTEGYLPPEGPGKPGADIYSLGKVIYEISTGKNRNDYPELPSFWESEAERARFAELNQIILRACDPNTRRRYPSAEELAGELAMLPRGRSVVARHARQRMLRAGGRGIAALLALAAAGASSYWILRQPSLLDTVVPPRLAVNDAVFWGGNPARLREFDVSPDGRRIVFAKTNGIWLWDAATSLNRPFTSAEIEIEDGDRSAAKSWFVPRGTAAPRWTPDGSHFVFQAGRRIGGTAEAPAYETALMLANPENGQIRRIGAVLPVGDHVLDLCWMPDGKAVTYLDGKHRFYTMLLNGGRTLWVDVTLPDKGPVRFGGYSNDGNWLLFSALNDANDVPGAGAGANAGDIWMMPHAGGRAVPLIQRRGVDVDPTWSPDGATVYFISDDEHRLGHTWALWSIQVDLKSGLAKGLPERAFTRVGQKLHHPKFVAGGKVVYVVEQPDTTILLADADHTARAAPLIRRGSSPVLAPNGQTIYFVGEAPEQQGIHAIDRSGGSRTLRKVTDLTPSSHGLTRTGISLSPDGERIAFFSFDFSQKRFGIFIVPAAGGDARLIEEWPDREDILPVWSPDSQWLAFSQGESLYRARPDGSGRETLATLYRWQGCTVRWSPNGEHLAALAYETPQEWDENIGVFVVNVTDRSWRKMSPASEDKYKEGLEWHPSGQYLTYMFYGPEPESAQIRRAYLDGRPTDLMIDQVDHWDYLGLWEPGGRWFYFTSDPCKGPRSNLHRYDAQTGEITHGLGGGALPSWSADGRTMVRTTGPSERWFEMFEHVP